MILHYFGRNSWQLNQDRIQIKQHFFDKNPGAEWNYYQLDQDSPDQIIKIKQLLGKQPFMSKTILIVLFNPEAKTLEWLSSQENPDDIVVAVFETSNRPSKWISKVSSRQVERKLPSEQEMISLLEKFLPNRSRRFYQEVLGQIVEFDTRGQLASAEQYWKFRQELGKLKGYNELSDKEVLDLITQSYYGDAFGLIKAINKGSREQLVGQLDLINKSNQDWYQILGLLIWYMITLVKIGFVKDPQELEGLGVKAFNYRQYQKTAIGLGKKNLEKLLGQLISADRLHKSSSVEVRFAVERFVFEFQQILSNQPI